MRLTSLGKAHLYIPGVIDAYMTKTTEGAWILPAPLYQVANGPEKWAIRPEDLYLDRKDSIQQVLDDELMRMINNRMFDDDDGERGSVSEV